MGNRGLVDVWGDSDLFLAGGSVTPSDRLVIEREQAVDQIARLR